MIDVETLRKEYPEPQQSPAIYTEDAWNQGYCVGATVCFAAGFMDAAYPDDTYLAKVLTWVNRRLTHDDALHIAEEIIRENDEGNFDVAWAWLDKGLTA